MRVLQAAPDINYIGAPPPRLTARSQARALTHPPPLAPPAGLARSKVHAHEHREASRGMPAWFCQPREVCGVRLVALGAFLDSTHVARVSWYRRCVYGTERRAPLPRGCFLEDTMGQAQLAELRRSGVASHAFYGTWLAHAGETQGMVVCHLDGHDRRCDRADWHKWRFAEQHTSNEEWARREESGELRYGDPPRYEVAAGFFDAAVPGAPCAAAAEPSEADACGAGS